jgi:hypothetical protein
LLEAPAPELLHARDVEARVLRPYGLVHASTQVHREVAAQCSEPAMDLGRDRARPGPRERIARPERGARSAAHSAIAIDSHTTVSPTWSTGTHPLGLTANSSAMRRDP